MAVAAGDLDTGFGRGGYTVTDIGGWAQEYGMVLQPDGKAVVVGDASAGTVVARFNADGTLDTGFGEGGRTLTDFTGSRLGMRAVALQPDGKIVTAGGVGGNAVVARFNTDGSPDTGFGTGGRTTFDFGSTDWVNAVAIQPDGKIVTVGGVQDSTYTAGSVVARFNADGSPDTGFGTGGHTVTGFGVYNGARAVAIQPDGRIVTVGYANGGKSALERFNADGSPDAGFGTGGHTIMDHFGAWVVALQPDGKIVTAGGDGGHAVARFNADGSPDTGFGTGGRTAVDLGLDNWARGMAIQPDGKIITAGFANASRGSRADTALVRFNADGSPDTGFGTGGHTVIDLGGAGGDDAAHAVALQPDGKIITAGHATGGTALARFCP
ncbi:delta-60 repeat domain-containing protein [Streptomyces sp. S.PB5]|uniref:delta-60 repeat domain-containing protein n=1 Tax=Streptomyces sp. S.PB5 TaxID=3020844 RepID=UPI0025B2272C|nr:delta-60 repeat domain-containing protein [Streptomyces sp. S.PB5]MDN3026185.1 delta-60 repeat domain-containing protein [Streptomyces sp. S.PB5]